MWKLTKSMCVAMVYVLQMKEKRFLDTYWRGKIKQTVSTIRRILLSRYAVVSGHKNISIRLQQSVYSSDACGSARWRTLRPVIAVTTGRPITGHKKYLQFRIRLNYLSSGCGDGSGVSGAGEPRTHAE